MPNFVRLREHAEKLVKLLEEPQEGVGSWCLAVARQWQAITEMWEPSPKTCILPASHASECNFGTGSIFPNEPVCGKHDAETTARFTAIAKAIAADASRNIEAEEAIVESHGALVISAYGITILADRIFQHLNQPHLYPAEGNLKIYLEGENKQ